MNFILHMNTAIITVISVLYMYQMVYIGIVFIGELVQKYRRKKHAGEPVKQHRFAALISARNESNVIGQLLDTINSQNYPSELLDAIVIADNLSLIHI